MSYNAELRERDKKFKELQQEVRVLMENIKSDILQNKTKQYLQNKATAHIKSFINFFKQMNIKRHIMLGSLYGFGPLMARYAI